MAKARNMMGNHLSGLTGDRALDAALEAVRQHDDLIRRHGVGRISAAEEALGISAAEIAADYLTPAKEYAGHLPAYGAAQKALTALAVQTAAEEALGLSSAHMAALLAQNQLDQLGSLAHIGTTPTLEAEFRRMENHAKHYRLENYRSPERDVLDRIGEVGLEHGAIVSGGEIGSGPYNSEVGAALPETEPSNAIPKRHRRTGPAPLSGEKGKADATISSTADIGRRIRDARRAMGMTQQRFADLAGVGRRFLGELERGKASLEIGRVLAVCEAAGIRLGFVS